MIHISYSREPVVRLDYQMPNATEIAPLTLLAGSAPVQAYVDTFTKTFSEDSKTCWIRGWFG